MNTMRIVLASNNRGKLDELQTLFAPLGVELVAQGVLFQGEAEEPFETFLENALAKARYASERTGLPAIADDAGLCVDAFHGLPGVQTAYYGRQMGYPAGDSYNVRALLEQMAGLADRRATMVCTLVGVRHPLDPQPLVAVGRAQMQIALAPIGDNGFGFDPVLFLPELGKTFAQLPDSEKNARSHRGRASRQMLQLVRDAWLPPADATSRTPD